MRCRDLTMCVVAVFAFYMNAPALTRLTRAACRLATSWQQGYRSTGETVDAARRMALVAKANGKSIAYCRSRKEGLIPIERSRIMAMSWELSPVPVSNGLFSDVVGADAIVAAEYEPTIDAALCRSGYRICDSGGGIILWCLGDGWNFNITQVEHKCMAESFALISMLAFFIFCYFVGRCEGVVIGMTGLSVVTFIEDAVFGLQSPELSLLVAFIIVVCLKTFNCHMMTYGYGRCSTSFFVLTGKQVLLVSMLFTLYALFALSHTFVSPNGLGTVGGKAKLMFLAGRIPDGYFRDYAYDLFQPAYPPGAASLVLWCYTLCGFCGEWIIQLLPCLLVAMLAGYLMSRQRCFMCGLMVLCVFATPLSIRLATLFYPEVYVAVCCIVGWERLRENKVDYVGWLLIGVSGWFKNEGFVYFCSMVLSVLVTSQRVDIRKLFRPVTIGAILPVIWHLGCRLAGATLDGYLPLGQLRLNQFTMAVCRAVQYMFYFPWQYAFIFPVAITLFVLFHRRNHNLKVVIAGVFFTVVGFAFIFSLSAAHDFAWHLDSMERLLWLPSLFLFRECLCFMNNGVLRTECTRGVSSIGK